MTLEPCRDNIAQYIETVFSYCEGFIPLRAFPEKGNDGGEKPHAIWIENNAGVLDKTVNFARWTHEHRMACYCIPGTVAEEKQAAAADVKHMQTLLIDIDHGDIAAKYAHLTHYIGEPSLVVESGGITPEGQNKLHVYWKLSEPAEGEDLQKLLYARYLIAIKSGGDTHFKSAHQPIRIAGSVYHKHDQSRKVKIRQRQEREYHLSDIVELAAEMPPMEGIILPPQNPLDFNDAHDKSFSSLMTMRVREGGVDGVTRFEALSSIIGHWLRCHHEGYISHEEAWAAIVEYNAACIVPPWPEERLKEETNRLWKKHLAHHGEPKLPPAPLPATISTLTSYWAEELLADTSPMPEDIIAPRILTPGGLLVFGGAPKVGKSDFLLSLFMHLAAGQALLGFEPLRPLKIFYLQAEVQYHYLRERLQSLKFPPAIALAAAHNLLVTPQVRLLLNEAGVTAVAGHVQTQFGQTQPDIIAIDPLRNVFDGGKDGHENDNDAMMFFLQERVGALHHAVNADAGIILVHHTRKLQKTQFEQEPFQSLSGASSLRSAYTSGILLYRPDEERSERKLLFELRNGMSIPSKIVDKVNGRWIEIDASHQRLVNQTHGERLDAERIRKREVIVDILYEQAKLGKFYNPNQFAEAFENTHGLGGKDTILDRISVAATKGYVKYCKAPEKYELPPAGRSKYGYLCVEGMPQGAGDNAPIIYPTHYKHGQTGALLEVENPHTWVYIEEENA